MMGEPAVRLTLLFYFIHLFGLDWCLTCALIFVDEVLKNHDINSNKSSKNKGKKTCKNQVCNQQRIN